MNDDVSLGAGGVAMKYIRWETNEGQSNTIYNAVKMYSNMIAIIHLRPFFMFIFNVFFKISRRIMGCQTNRNYTRINCYIGTTRNLALKDPNIIGKSRISTAAFVSLCNI